MSDAVSAGPEEIPLEDRHDEQQDEADKQEHAHLFIFVCTVREEDEEHHTQYKALQKVRYGEHHGIDSHIECWFEAPNEQYSTSHELHQWKQDEVDVWKAA